MKTKIITILAATLLAVISPAQADTVWTSGHNEILDGDIYGEIWMYNDCTLDILGGDIYRLAAYDTTVTDWFAGEMVTLWVNGNSIVNIYGGSLEVMAAIENGQINLYAYDIVSTTTGGRYDIGQVMGYYYSDNSYFYFDLGNLETYTHINIVPEPTTFLLLFLGILMVKRKY